MNTHGNDVWKTDGPPCDKHFQMLDHSFSVRAKIRSLLEQREDYCILKLHTLSLQGLNISLNYPQDTTGFTWQPY